MRALEKDVDLESDVTKEEITEGGLIGMEEI